jgi:hypothetical protein
MTGKQKRPSREKGKGTNNQERKVLKAEIKRVSQQSHCPWPSLSIHGFSTCRFSQL